MSNFNFNQLNMMLVDNIELLLCHFDIEYKQSYSYIQRTCPLHDGDNKTAFVIYLNTGVWHCFSHNCHLKYGGNLVGLLRGLLSKKEDVDIVSIQDTVQYAFKLLDISAQDLRQYTADLEKRKLNEQASIFFNNDQTISLPTIKRSHVREKLAIPSHYYLARQYPSGILDRYDIGDCTESGLPMTDRAVVPIYDEQHKFMIGCSGRSNNGHLPKWKHSKDFQVSNFLYNLWFAKDYIFKSKVAILVESPGNVWRLEENDIHNSLALFGCQVSRQQEAILSTLGILALIVIMDNDNAGQKAYDKIKNRLNKLYRIFKPTIHTNDVGDMSQDEITSDIKPMIEEVNNIYQTFS